MHRFIITMVFTLLIMTAAHKTRAEVFVLGEGNDVIGQVTKVRSVKEDTLVDIARRHGLGYTDVVLANPDVDPWLPGEGTEITLPTRFVLPDAPRRGIVLNLAEYRLYFYPEPLNGEPRKVVTYPISIGRMDWETPLGRTKVVAKAVRPSWYVPESVHQERLDAGDPPLPRVVPPGPDNPLGTRAMRLGLPGYLIHGTNRPAGVGMRVTHGCIRMFPEDITVFFEDIPVGTPVMIVNQAIKFGRYGDQVFMEAHEFLEQPEVAAGGADESEQTQLSPLSEMTRQFVAFAGKQVFAPDWEAMESILDGATGIPLPFVVMERPVSVSATSPP
ncbi:MAG: L,D-transpeptidase family protein [Woeseiaceae bacterium]